MGVFPVPKKEFPQEDRYVWRQELLVLLLCVVKAVAIEGLEAVLVFQLCSQITQFVLQLTNGVAAVQAKDVSVPVMLWPEWEDAHPTAAIPLLHSS